MRATLTDEARFERLLRRFVDGIATTEEREAFCGMLRDQPAHIAHYAAHLELMAAASCLDCARAVGASPRASVSAGRRTGWWKAAAAVAVLSVSAALWLWLGAHETRARVMAVRGICTDEAPVVPDVPPSAQVLVESVSADGAASDASLPEAGARESLSSITLAGGSYSFRLEQGVTCCLFGPASLAFRGKGHVILSRGTLLAEIEPQASGFLVETPLLRVRDLGTRFGVAVSGAGTTDVVVAQGRVVFEDTLGRVVMPLNGGSGARVTDAGAFRLFMASGLMPESLDAWCRRLSSGGVGNKEGEMSTRTTVVSMGVAAVMSVAMSSLYAGDGAWTGSGAGALNYWDPANWLNGQVANGAGSAAYFTNALNPKIVLTNDVTLGYLQVAWPNAAGDATFEGGSLTLQGSSQTIRTDNRKVNFRTVMRGSSGFVKTGNNAFYPCRKSEMAGTNRLSQGTLGLDFRQDADSTNALALNHLNPDGLIFDTYGGQVRVGGRPSPTTDQTGVFTLDVGSRRVARVSGVSVLSLSAGQLVTAAGGALSAGTYLKTVLDDNTFELSAAPLSSGDTTLTFKAALFNTVQEFNLLQTSVSGSLYAGVGTGGGTTTARIGALAGGYGLTADGSATLELQNTRDFGGVIALTNTLTLAMTDQRAVPLSPATNSAFHVDASASNTMTLTQSGNDKLVGIWNDKNGAKVTGSSTTVRFAVSQGNRPNLLAPLLVTNALNGLPVVDFGAAGSKRGMLWNENYMTNILAFFMVVGSREGGGILLGAKDNFTCSFERGMDVYASKGAYASKVYTTPLTRNHALFLDRAAPPSNSAWLNGQPVDHQYTGLSGDYDLCSFVWNENTIGGSASAFAWRGISASTNYNERTGGQRLAEVIVYQRVLTDQERRDTEAYLYYKWFGKTLAGYGAPKISALRAFGSGNALEQRGSNAIEVASLNLRSGATLTVRTNTVVTVKSATLAGTVALAGGTLSVTSRATPLVPPGQTVLHLDATTNLTFSGAEIARWDDCAGSNRYAFSYSGFGPAVVSNALNGLPAVDFGAIGSKKFLAWDTNVVIRSLFLVVKVLDNNSAPLGSYQPMMGVASHFTRQASQIWAPAGQATVRSGACYLDGERVNPGMFNMTANSFVLLGQVMDGSSIANAFACEAYLYTDPNNRSNRTGGLQLAEVLIYNRKLSEQESLDAQAYLNWKWFGRVSGGYAAPGGSMNVAAVYGSTSAAQSVLTVDGDAPVSLGQVSGNGSVLLNSAVPVTIGSLATLTGGLKLTNTTVAFSQAATLSAFDLSGRCTVSVSSGTPVTAGALTGSGTLVKTGSGTFTVNNGSAFSGSLILQDGTLALGSGAQLDVASLTGADATLTGGSIKAMQVSAGLGSSAVGTLTLSNLELKQGATVTVNVSGQTCDRVDVTGALSAVGGGTFQMTFANNLGYAGHYTVFTFGSLDAQSEANIGAWSVAGDIPAKFKRTVLVKDNKVSISISPRGTVMTVR